MENAVFSQQQIPTILEHVDESSLINYSHNFCKYSRNEIFARLGYAFKNKDLDLYFSRQAWYKKDEDATISLSLEQKRYIALFQQIEKQKKPKQYTSGKLDEYPVFFYLENGLSAA
ncbi:MAG: YARHG domain-containing protein [Bacteroidota bacterium]|nr:YARHG domain-containing protein [Bacteroidota bacterium]